MKKDVLISIKGVQRVEGQEEVIELMTVGNLYKKKDSYYLSYEETEATGFGGSKTTLRLEQDGRVTMLRSGAYRSHLIVEKGRRHQCVYDTGYGEMMIGVLGNQISSTLTDKGGNIQFKYSLDINTSLASENEVYIDVKECK
ncbi:MULTISPECIES: DUF1934 domain-containing protein [Oscillospiraceae]|uniref:Uncharacterized beta-barrel protein YwiB (DUF1934 family) n=1 Tax=Harryflintia acetispora TaxID=1849041 RepID=A0A9X8Y7Y4_9FIRM|nr:MULTISPECIES: DUF1934 domain-containing protein [Oscillospiraceae]TCL43037.1 uncharacterized beta-barrel protein YwiB (DUF1934 family) [Harryflintia acetispora]